MVLKYNLEVLRTTPFRNQRVDSQFLQSIFVHKDMTEIITYIDRKKPIASSFFNTVFHGSLCQNLIASIKIILVSAPSSKPFRILPVNRLVQ